MLQYLPCFNFSAERAAEPDFFEQPSKCVAAKVSTHVTSQTSVLPRFQGIKVTPSGLSFTIFTKQSVRFNNTRNVVKRRYALKYHLRHCGAEFYQHFLNTKDHDDPIYPPESHKCKCVDDRFQIQF
jgi:hypothetical protein